MPAQKNASKVGVYLGCMDRRIQQLALTYAKNQYDAIPDKITEPGIVSILVGKRKFAEQPEKLIEWIRIRAVEVSMMTNGATIAFVVGHSKCAGHDESDAVHRKDVEKAVDVVAAWGFEKVVGLFAVCDEEGEWRMEYVTTSGAPLQTRVA